MAGPVVATPASAERARKEAVLTELLAEDVDVSKLVLDVVKGHRLDFNVVKSVLDARVRETMDGAPTLEITIHDGAFILLESNVLFFEDKHGERRLREIRVTIPPNREYELAALKWAPADEGSGVDLTLIFEHVVVAEARQDDKPRKVSRSKMTRAEFVRSLVKEIKDPQVRFVSPELHKRQPVARGPAAERRQVRDSNRSPGLDPAADITVKGNDANRSQLKVIEDVLDEGDKQGASTKVLIVGIMVITQESSASNAATNGNHKGAFQQDPRYWPASRNATTDAAAFFKKAIKIDKGIPGLTYDELAEKVQASGQGSLYAQWKSEATRTVRAYKGSGGESRSFYKQYLFSRGINGQRENSWDCAARLATEVNWRSFVSGRASWFFISEPDLFKSRSRMKISRSHPAVIGISGDLDKGKKLNTLTVTARIRRWRAPAGSVVTVSGYGPADGRWLVQDIERSLFSPEAEVTLKKPSKPKKEPRAEVASEQNTKERDGTAAKLYQECIAISKLNLPYVYGGGHGPALRAMTNRYLSPQVHRPSYVPPKRGLDCSSSVSLALFRAGLFDGSVSIVSGSFASSWGKPGKGRRFTVWANSEHVWIQFHDLGKWWRFDTSPHGSGGSGPHVRSGSRPTGGFTPRHWPGL